MKIFTYFKQDPTLPDFSKVLNLWKAEWLRAGHYPIVLTEEPTPHLWYREVMRHIKELPSVNSPAYTYNDFMRWLAMDLVGGGLHVDSDVLPGGVRLPKETSFSDETMILTEDRCPCAVWVKPYSFTRLMLDYNEPEFIGGKPHFSDQGFFRWIGDELSCEGMCHIHDGKFRSFLDHPMVHYPTGVTSQWGDNKADVIEWHRSFLTVPYAVETESFPEKKDFR